MTPTTNRFGRRRQFLDRIMDGTVDIGINVSDEVLNCCLKGLELRQHQLSAIQKMIDLEKMSLSSGNAYEDSYVETNYGILCDKVGSGKSIMLLGLMTVKKCVSESVDNEVIDYSYVYGVGYRISTKKIMSHIPCNIVVVPHTLCKQWASYVNDLTDFRMVCLTRPIELTKCKKQIEESEYDVVILSNKVYQIFCDEFADKSFSRVVFDEVDTIDIPNTKRIRGGFFWFVSASVINITCCNRRNKGFLIDVLHMNRSVYNHFLYVRNNDRDVDSSMRLQIPITTIVKCRTQRILNLLGGVIPQRIQQMISGGDIRGAMDELNIFNDTSDNILMVVTDSFQRQLQNEKVKLEMHNRSYFASDNERNRAIQECESTIKELERKIQLVKDRIEDEDVDPITYDTIDNPVITKCCQNKFDARSILDYIRFKSQTSNIFCPMCKATPFSMKSIVHLVKEKGVVRTAVKTDSEWVSEDYDKIENLRNLYKTEKIKINDKVLIMTQFNNSFGDSLASMLREENVAWCSLQTSGLRLVTIIDRYVKGDIDCLVLNTNHYGAGLNLELTDHVVFLHAMPYEVEMQAVGRAQRIGRKNVLKVWKLYDNYEN